MKSQKSHISGQGELFRNRLENIINPDHELVELGNSLDWEKLHDQIGLSYCEDNGRPALDSRLMIGLQLLKYLYSESDESVVARFCENPYWQFFCGNKFFEHELPCHPTSLVKWRKRIGVKGAEKILRETLELAKRHEVVSDCELQEVNIDTTVQPKNVAFPTDARLLNTARRSLVRAAKQEGVELRQSYKRVGQKTLLAYVRNNHRKNPKKARKYLRKLRTLLGRVIRDVERKCQHPSEKLRYLLGLVKKLFGQKKGSKKKIYSIHAPEVQCIAKGKVHKKYEFGSKVSVATAANSNWVLGIHSFIGNPFDGHTVPDVLCQIKDVTGHFPKAAYCDRGYKGSEGHIFETQVYIQGSKSAKTSAKINKRLRSRSSIEPIIGHLKSDHRMARNFLLGFQGDQINALMAGCAFNLRKLIRALIFWVIITHLREGKRSLCC